MTDPNTNVPPPLFTSNDMSAPTQAAVNARMGGNNNAAALNLDDIFGDVVFTPDGDTVFLEEQAGQDEDEEQVLLNSGEGNHVATVASKPTDPSSNNFAPVPQGGGLYTTHLMDAGQQATQMGAPAPNVKPTAPVPFSHTPQQAHHLQYATKKTSTTTTSTTTTSTGLKKTSSRSDRKMSEQQKVERRERNREHAKRSRIRKKFLLESLQQSVTLLKEENDKLRNSIRSHLGDDKAKTLLDSTTAAANAAGATGESSSKDGLLASQGGMANKVLDDPDFSFIKALQTAQQNFVVTDPSLPDNPIVYASQGFLNLTGYSLDQILGRNCRFLQGPETDPKSVERIRKAIETGQDMSVCLLNYRVDGTTFWNQFFIAALRDASGTITNFVGVQCKVSDQYAAAVTKQQQEQAEQQQQQQQQQATAVSEEAAK